MATKPILLALLSLSLLLTPATPLTAKTLADAASTLSTSGYTAMSLTLSLLPKSLLSSPLAATIFSPPDSAFSASGQPPLSLLQLHFSPQALSFDSLRSLPFTTAIPTFLPNKPLFITTASPSDRISIDNVTITGSSIFEDGSLIVYGIETFFDPDFVIFPPTPSPSPQICVPPTNYSSNLFRDASEKLRSNGYSIFASFLDLQLPLLLGSNPTKPYLTVLAPVDELMFEYAGNFSEYPSLFTRHVLPCRLGAKDLAKLANGTVFATYLNGFRVKISVYGHTLKVNEGPVSFLDMYYSDWLVVHGLREILSVPGIVVEGEGETAAGAVGEEESLAPDRGDDNVAMLSPFLVMSSLLAFYHVISGVV
ncbi:hypothetical protein RJ639_029261 [Escallonia herrerae]|uniref:FAS1 domain-containing protein n=1 Tax=Escallonia herrerae TaxID=1293975 RepID=A0AA89BEJ4_9ASTE|nr:hypothetical protein RJ639_029261 [Escallonia herrerae]